MHRARFSAAGLLGALLLMASGCSDDTQADPASTADAGSDTGIDASGDAGIDVTPDAASDAPDGYSAAACRGGSPPPAACGSPGTARATLIPGPNAAGFDSALAIKARRFDRQFHALNAHAAGVNADIVIAPNLTDERESIRQFVQDTDGWDYAATSGKTPAESISWWGKVAGLYAGNGIAADAYRYATLRTDGSDCAELDVARAHVIANLDALHLATRVTGVPGVIARGWHLKDVPGSDSYETVPLKNSAGDPLPEEKNNGTWRDDNSGEYPNVIWEDSCSRDMIVGWALGYAATWEVIRDDDAIDSALKSRLQADASAILTSLRRVGPDGHDLLIWDADGRPTYHGLLHEDGLDRVYVPGFQSGFQALMALGIVGGFAYVAEDPDHDSYLYDQLIEARRLHELSRDKMIGLDLGVKSNYSGYNMVFTAAWIASRYLCHEAARAAVVEATESAAYARPGKDRQPVEQGQSLYDIVYAATQAGSTAWAAATGKPDADALARGLNTLDEFPDPPFFSQTIENCDDAEVQSTDCTAVDGTKLTLLGYEGRGDTLVSLEPVPMRIRPHSNYYWRSNPYQVNGGSDNGLLPAVDFRFVYWAGRWATR